MLTTKPLYHNTVRSVPFSTTLCVPEQAVWRRKWGHVAYTGQEEDKESGLLYYKARYYDPGLGRFIQADEEVHPETVQGMNRSMYTNGSPNNFIDESGNSRSKSTTQNIAEYFMLSQIIGGQNPGEVHDSLIKLYIYFAHVKNMGKGKQFDGPYWKGHNYTGSGNKDPFDGFFSWNSSTKQDKIEELFILSRFVLNIPLEHAVIFFFILPLLRPPAKGYMDVVAIKHDDESPNSAGSFTSSKDSWKIVEADARYIQRFGDGLIKGKLNLEELVVGLGGFRLFSDLSIPIHGAYAIGKGTMEEISRNKGRFVIRPACLQPKGLTGITTGGMF
jgi:RHS repeat-associated protein